MSAGTNPTYYDGDLRRDLLDAALDVIVAEGPSALSLRAVARRVGVSHAAPKNHFPDKAALFTAIAVEGFEGLGGALRAAAVGADDPVSAVQASGAAYVDFAVSHPGHFRVMWRSDLLGDDDRVLQHAGERAFNALVGIAARARSVGWAEGFTPEDVAAVAWSTVHGLAQLWLDGPLGDMDGRRIDDLTDRVTRSLVEAFGRPAVTRPGVDG